MLLQMAKFSFFFMANSPHTAALFISDGHVGCFHILAIVNNTMMNIWIYIYLFKLMFSFLSDIYPGVDLLNHMVILFLVFREHSH